MYEGRFTWPTNIDNLLTLCLALASRSNPSLFNPIRSVSTPLSLGYFAPQIEMCRCMDVDAEIKVENESRS